MLRPISISLSPNTDKQDVSLALRLLFQPWKWKKGKYIEKLEDAFKAYLRASFAVSFNSGRSSLLAILSCLGFERGDEILLQAFTCNAVPNPVRWAGFKPVYVDCNQDDLNINVKDLEEKITKKSRAVIVQHTFGMPADLKAIQDVCKRRNLVLIEDCAHALGAEYQRKKVGTFGKAAFFSFSRDKIISSVYGGMATTSDPVLGAKLKEYQEKTGYPSLFWIQQQLLHPILMNWLILPSYGVFGKYVLVLFQMLHLLSKAVHWKEKRGVKPAYFPKRLPNAQAVLALAQFEKLGQLNAHRNAIAQHYERALQGTAYSFPRRFPERTPVYLRFPVFHAKAHSVISKAWKRNLLLGDWYTSPIAPEDTILESIGYVQGSCKTAEALAQKTLNLPTHIGIRVVDALYVVEFIQFHGR